MMTRREFVSLRDIVAKSPMLTAKQLRMKEGTVLFGYNTDRHTCHVYKTVGNILHSIVYDGNDLLSHRFGHSLLATEMIPNKRLYPERCDYQACVLLQEQGVHLPFTSYTDVVVEDIFWYGAVANASHAPKSANVLVLNERVPELD